MINFKTDALQLAELIRNKKMSPLEVAQHYIDVTNKKNDALNAVIWRNDEELCANAKKLTDLNQKKSANILLAPFAGVPLPVKDLSEVTGHPYTMGSRACRNQIGIKTSDIVRFSQEAGFLISGRTNSPEFGILPVTENKLYGATSNPWNLKKTAGGSSGGAAAAVVSGMTPIALASDGGGSIRIPASCNGLVGLKPSRGRIPRGPSITDVFHGLSVDGCVSKTVRDTAAFLDATARSDKNAWYSAPPFKGSYLTECQKTPKPLKIGYSLRGVFDYPTQPEVIKVFEKTIIKLEALGHEVSEIVVPFNATGNIAQAFLKIWMTGAAYSPVENWSDTEDLTQAMRAVGLQQNSLEYVDAVVQLQVFSRYICHFFHNSMDIFLTPTLAMEPPDHGWVFATGEKNASDLLERCSKMVPSTSWVNVTGQPAISLPMGWSTANLPIGMQFIGQPFREDVVLQLAFQIEKHFPWIEKYKDI